MQYRTSFRFNPALHGKDFRWRIWILHVATTALVATNRSSSAANVIEAISTASMDVPRPQRKNAANATQSATETVQKASALRWHASVVIGYVKQCLDQILSRANNTGIHPNQPLHNPIQHPLIWQ